MPVKTKSSETITVNEITRKTSAGRFAYAMYNGKVVRRASKRGRPHYDVVAGISLTSAEKPTSRDIPVTSQLARMLLG
jgi:hypothetical protein